jgi:hypothetical protein
VVKIIDQLIPASQNAFE